MNEFQFKCSQVYAGGAFEGLDDFEESGDTLYIFLMRELSDVVDEEEALKRLRVAAADIEQVIACL